MPNDEKTPAEVSGFTALVNPIVLIALLILFSVFVLIGAAIIGFDKGVLSGMARIEFARGLITYLFAIVTIGTAVVLVVSALTSTESEAHEKRFQRGKEILSLLLGVFGTIVGFYFGSEVTQKTLALPASLVVAPIHLSSQTVESGGQLTLETYVSGGKPPYKFGVGFDGDPVESRESVEPGGWIQKTVASPKVSSDQAVVIHVVVIDSEGLKGEQSAPLIVRLISK
jgi:hypothetical protein